MKRRQGFGVALLAGLLFVTHFMFFTGVGQAQECVATIQPVSAASQYPNLAAGPVAWSGSRLGVLKSDTQTSALYFTAYARDLTPLTADRLVASSTMPTATQAGPIALLWNGSEFAAFFLDSQGFLIMQRIDANATLIGAPVSPLINQPVGEREEFDIVWDGTNYLVARIAPPSYLFGLWSTVLTREGIVVSDRFVTALVDSPARPRVASVTDDRYVITWDLLQDGRESIYAVPFSKTTGQGQLQELAAGADFTNAGLVSNGTTLLVLVRDQPHVIIATPPPNFPFVTIESLEIDAIAHVVRPMSLLVRGSGSYIEPKQLLWNGSEYALSYVDQPNGPPSGDFRLRRFTKSLGLIADTLVTPDFSKRSLSSDYRFAFDGFGYTTAIARTVSTTLGADSYLTRRCPFAAADVVVPRRVVRNSEVTFRASATGGVAPYSYAWDFGVEFERGATGNVVSTLYKNRGTYTVTLTITDAQSQTTTVTQTIEVVDPRKRLAKH